MAVVLPLAAACGSGGGDGAAIIARAQDGLRARVGGPWTREKLDYVGRYAAAFMKAMHPKRRAGIWSELVYIDPLAGPGLGIARDRSSEFDGSPLRGR